MNERLGKEVFDCSEISDKYACGCADDETDAAEAEGRAKEEYVKEAEAKADAEKTKKNQLPITEPSSSVAAPAAVAHEGNEVLDTFKLDIPSNTEDDKSPLVLEKGG